MSAEIETMALNKNEGLAWHGLGKQIDGFMTMAEALEYGGLNWLVEKKPIYDGLGNVIPHNFATTRHTDNKVLGIVGECYKVLQNNEALSFLDTLIGTGKAVYDTVASLKGGSKIFATVKIPDDNIDKTDPIEKYLLVTNSHDGSSPIQVLATDIRVVCSNTLTMAIKGSRNSFSVRHTTNLATKLHEAERVLSESVKYFKNSHDFYNHLKEVKFSEKQLSELVSKVYNFEYNEYRKDDSEISTRSVNILDDILELSYTGKGATIPGVQGSAYGAFNAVTEYLDHYSTSRVHGDRSINDVKVESIHYGSISQKRNALVSNIQEMIQVPA